MERIRLLKRISAIILFVSFFLPLAQCSYTVPQSGAGDDEKSVQLVVSDISGFTAYKWPSFESMLALIAFGWAAFVQLFSLRNKSLETNRNIFVIEILLSVLTIGGISWLVYWGHTVRFGAVVAYTAVLLYLGAAIYCQNITRHPNKPLEGTR